MEERKKILYVVEAMGGGVFTYIVDLSNELINEYDIYIAYGIRKQTPSNYKSYFDKNIKLIEIENFDRSINLLKDIKAFFEIKKIAKDVEPDIIHLHSSKAGVLGRFAFNGKYTPIFYTPHGYSFLMTDQNMLKRAIYKTIEIISAKRRCITISCSKGENEESLKLTKNAIYVNNGINTEKLEQMIDKKENSKRHPDTVFTIGRICYQKNPYLFNKIAMAMPEIKFTWIGDGELKNVLTAPNIKITGWMDRKNVMKYIQESDIFILTSLWEGLPISLLEAMYMKKICIVSDVIGNRDVIHTGNNGFVCSTVDEYVSAIRIANSANMENITMEAYDNIYSSYNTKVMAKKYSDIYSKAIYYRSIRNRRCMN